MKLKLSKVAEFISASPPGSAFSEDLVAQAYSIDSRTIKAGDLFFAVKGERLDGHDFVDAALKNGAIAAVVSKDQAHRFGDQTRLLPVDDTLLALQTLA